MFIDVNISSSHGDDVTSALSLRVFGEDITVAGKEATQKRRDAPVPEMTPDAQGDNEGPKEEQAAAGGNEPEAMDADV